MAKGRSKLEGRKIDTWEFVIAGKKLSVDVRLTYSKHSYQNEFYVHWQTPDGRQTVELRDADINKLKRDTKERLTAAWGVAWENFLHVEISSTVVPEPGADIYDDDDDRERDTEMCEKLGRPSRLLRTEHKAEIELKYETVEVGTHVDGSKSWRPLDSRHISHMTQEGMPDTYPRTDDGDDRYERTSRQLALIPDTPENRAALESIRAAFNVTVEKLYAALHPDNIQERLLSFGQLAFPAPTETKCPTPKNPRKKLT